MTWHFLGFTFGSSSKAVTDRKKEGKREIAKFQYTKNEKSFLGEVKSFL